ncbi:hypothetical protein CS8_009870 [Cupriavidus sp. 8B]
MAAEGDGAVANKTKSKYLVDHELVGGVEVGNGKARPREQRVGDVQPQGRA